MYNTGEIEALLRPPQQLLDAPRTCCAVSSISAVQCAMRSPDRLAAPPPYSPAQTTSSRLTGRDTRGRPNLALLPLPILYRIVALTLDERATPNRWRADPEEERVRRVWGLHQGLRGVSRSFWLGTYL